MQTTTFRTSDLTLSPGLLVSVTESVKHLGNSWTSRNVVDFEIKTGSTFQLLQFIDESRKAYAKENGCEISSFDALQILCPPYSA